ncbi:hypothetical protein O181_010199 [Austropuccinia psidii MF-1]|uniref:Uncharacterized protein n=1 Tax=Austropuccinia psidii MF-1 TaxID=1389203 RepID=A0A9Q3GKL7_9BASI|nr:hypothetical protein [Austropuccinia psidii MF-1]
MDNEEKIDEARMNLKDDIKFEIKLITYKIEKINEANLNMPNLSTPFSHIRIPFKAKEEIQNPFITDFIHQDKSQILMKEVRQLQEWSKFTGEEKYDHMSFVKLIVMLKKDYAIQDEPITARLNSSLKKSAKRWCYGMRKANGKNTWSWWKNKIITKGQMIPEDIR